MSLFTVLLLYIPAFEMSDCLVSKVCYVHNRVKSTDGTYACILTALSCAFYDDNKWAWFIASLFVNNCSGARVGSVAKASGND